MDVGTLAMAVSKAQARKARPELVSVSRIRRLETYATTAMPLTGVWTDVGFGTQFTLDAGVPYRIRLRWRATVNNGTVTANTYAVQARIVDSATTTGAGNPLLIMDTVQMPMSGGSNKNHNFPPSEVEATRTTPLTTATAFKLQLNCAVLSGIAAVTVPGNFGFISSVVIEAEPIA